MSPVDSDGMVCFIQLTVHPIRQFYLLIHILRDFKFKNVTEVNSLMLL